MGADLNWRDGTGASPLHLACAADNVEAVVGVCFGCSVHVLVRFWHADMSYHVFVCKKHRQTQNFLHIDRTPETALLDSAFWLQGLDPLATQTLDTFSFDASLLGKNVVALPPCALGDSEMPVCADVKQKQQVSARMRASLGLPSSLTCEIDAPMALHGRSYCQTEFKLTSAGLFCSGVNRNARCQDASACSSTVAALLLYCGPC